MVGSLLNEVKPPKMMTKIQMVMPSSLVSNQAPNRVIEKENEEDVQ